jgi:hypothetical protein
VQVEADAFDAHVAHAHAFGEVGDTEPLRALEFVEDAEPGAAADLLEEALLQGEWKVENREAISRAIERCGGR